MTYGSLVLTLVTVKERAAYVTREISVMNQKVGFILHDCFFLILYLIKNKTNEELLT
jgi:cyanate permease